ncbi:MAG: alginate lyase family protein [Abditibacteriota bacterium]|nr:alginate lyase family protein [Abditibacteriota bacterium]
MRYLLVAALLLMAAAVVFAQEGPRTPRKEFFLHHLDLSIPELAPIRELAQQDKIAEAERVFAEYVRKHADRQRLIGDWLNKKYTEEEKQALRDRASWVMDYTLSAVGVGYKFPDKKIDWESNHTYNGYKEWTWGLNRHHEWRFLAEYYVATGDEEAAEVYADMLEQWIRQAVVPLNAKSYETNCWRTIEAGLRMQSWTENLYAFLPSPYITDSVITDFAVSIYEHGWRLVNFHHTHNWLLMEMHGVIKLCLLWPFITDTAEWLQFATDTLMGEYKVQNFPDGYQYEMTVGYHGICIENYLAAANTMKQLGAPVPEGYYAGLEPMYEMYCKLARPDKSCPSLNDGNEAWAVATSRKALELFPDNPLFRWFAGKEGAREPDFLSYVFPYAGAVIFRTSWEPDALWAYMDCGPYGWGGHQHDDKLNVLLCAYGKKLIVEAGTYDYDTSDMRAYVLSTRSHNTVMIDGKEQNVRPINDFRPEDINKKADVVWELGPGREWAESQYVQGYGNDWDMTTHRRRLILLKDVPGTEPFLIVCDRFIAPDRRRRTYEQMWHLEECEYTQDASSCRGDFGDGVSLTMLFSDTDGETVNMKGRHEPYFQGWLPGSYAQQNHREVNTPTRTGSFEGSRRLVTVLYPSKGECPIASVTASGDTRSRNLLLNMKDGRVLEIRE